MGESGGLYALALSAGLLASVNPCGFALLPAYLSLLVVGRPDEEPAPTGVAVRRALGLTAAMTLGFVLVFGVFGLVVQPVASGVQAYLPWFTIALGAALAVMGAWLAAGRSMPSLPRLGRGGRGGRTGARGRPLTRSPVSMLGFGIGYALASLTCTIAPFLAVVVTAFRIDSTLTGVGLFVAYAAGMGLVVGTLAVGTALAAGAVRGGLVARVRASSAALSRVSGALLLAAGAYVAWYGFWELRVLGLLSDDLDAGDDPVIGAAEAMQRLVAQGVSSIGPLGWLGLAAALLAAAWMSRRRGARVGVRSGRG